MLGERLRLFRERRGLTLQEVADRSGLSRSYISEIENGKKQPSIKALEALTAALNVSLDALMPEGDTDGTIGDKVRMLREQLGLSRAELAEMADVTPGFIAQLENNKTQASLTTIRRIAQCLDVSPCYLILEDETAEEIIRALNPELRTLLQEPRVQLVLRMVCDMTDREFEFLLQFIRLLRRSGLQ